MGPMFSGKTQSLISIFNKYKYTDKKICVFKFKNDNRYSTSDNLCNFNKNEIDKKYIIICEYLLNPKNNILNNDIIFIDEGQFFKDLTDCIKILKLNNKEVYVSYLNLQYNNTPFKNGDVLNYADKITILSSICYKCKKNACITKLISENTEINKNTEINIGSDNMYKPSCMNCFYDS